jgi:hypothetical protein
VFANPDGPMVCRDDWYDSMDESLKSRRWRDGAKA